MNKIAIKALLAASLLVSLPGAVHAQAGKHFNIIGRSQAIEHGHGEIRVDGGGQEVSQIEVSVNGGPLVLTKVLVHFADKKIKPWPYAIKPRKDEQWTSNPVKWPSGKPHKVTSVEYWYTGVPGKKASIDLLGLQ